MRSKNFQDKKPLLYLVATPIGNLEDFSPRALKTLLEVDLIACEDTRVTGRLLSFFQIKKPLYSLREHNEVQASEYVIGKMKEGLKVAYVSDAGYPGISDPGQLLVEHALKNDINVSVIPGANALLTALVASGLDSSKFYFHGFLSAKESERINELKDLSKRKETIIFYEAPHRIEKTLGDLMSIFGNRSICIARELTKLHEEYIRDTLENVLELDMSTFKGEIVLVIEGNRNETPINIDDTELIKMVNCLERNGVSTKDAIKRVSENTSIPKNYIYKIYHMN